MQTRQIITPVWPIKGEVYGVAYRPDGQQAAITNGKNVVIVDAQGTSIITLTGHTGIVFSVAYSPDGRWLASGGGDANAYVWDTTTWQAISLTNHLRSVRSVAFSPDGQSLATGSWDKTILVVADQRDSGPHVIDRATADVDRSYRSSRKRGLQP